MDRLLVVGARSLGLQLTPEGLLTRGSRRQVAGRVLEALTGRKVRPQGPSNNMGPHAGQGVEGEALMSRVLAAYDIRDDGKRSRAAKRLIRLGFRRVE